MKSIAEFSMDALSNPELEIALRSRVRKEKPEDLQSWFVSLGYGISLEACRSLCSSAEEAENREGAPLPY